MLEVNVILRNIETVQYRKGRSSITTRMGKKAQLKSLIHNHSPEDILLKTFKVSSNWVLVKLIHLEHKHNTRIADTTHHSNICQYKIKQVWTSVKNPVLILEKSCLWSQKLIEKVSWMKIIWELWKGKLLMKC